MTHRVYLDRYECLVSAEALYRAIEVERRERLAFEDAIRLGRAGGPHPFLASSIAVTTSVQRALQAEAESMPRVVDMKRRAR